MLLPRKILAWFDKHGRQDLPWQRKPTPYRVWISEIMLQQTQVATVIPYFERFIKKFPDITTLAKASLDDVLYLWSGLGYYARAKNLHKAAQVINTEYNGKFPREYNQVLALPGIGRSTAGAILSISTKQRYPILDGNVKRVLSRHFTVEGWAGEPNTLKTLWELSEKITPHERVHHYTQAIMDLGALICTRTKPKCHLCPIAKTCKAKKLNRISHYPASRSKLVKPIKSAIFIIIFDQNSQSHLLEKRPAKGIWGGLWSLPQCPANTNVQAWCQKNLQLHVTVTKPLDPFRHSFTHFHLMIHPVLCHTPKGHSPLLSSTNYHWYSWEETDKLGLPAPIKRLLQTLRKIQNVASSVLCEA